MSEEDGDWEKWQDAFEALIAPASRPDPQPLADLLRSSAPMPHEAREVLAELFSPKSVRLFPCSLIVKQQSQKAKQKGLEKLEGALVLKRHRQGGSKKAAEAAAEEQGRYTTRTMFRRGDFYEQWRARMAEVMFGDLPKADD